MQSILEGDNLQSENNDLEKLYIFPYYLSVLHIYAIASPDKILNDSSTYSNLKVPFLVDIYNKTPLHYLIGREKPEYVHINAMLEYILEYLEDTDNRSKLDIRNTMMSLTSIFSFIIKKTNPKLRERLLALCCQKPDSEFSLPKFGTSGIKYTFAKVPVVDRRVFSSIYEPGQDQLIFTTMLTYLDYDPSSDDMLALISTLKLISDEEIFKSPIIAKVIDHLFKTSKNVFRICIFFYSAFMIIFSVYIGLGKRNLGLEITIACLAALLTLGEGLQLYTLRSYYYYDAWNVADTLENTLTFIFIGLKFGSTNSHILKLINNHNGVLVQQWLASLIILIGYMRWVSYLRYFKSTSKTVTIFLA